MCEHSVKTQKNQRGPFFRFQNGRHFNKNTTKQVEIWRKLQKRGNNSIFWNSSTLNVVNSKRKLNFTWVSCLLRPQNADTTGFMATQTFPWQPIFGNSRSISHHALQKSFRNWTYKKKKKKSLIFFNVLPEKNKNFGLGVFGYTGRNPEASRMLENQ